MKLISDADITNQDYMPSETVKPEPANDPDGSRLNTRSWIPQILTSASASSPKCLPDRSKVPAL